MKPLRAAALILLAASARGLELQDALRSDPELVEAVAQRVARSQLIGLLTREEDPSARVAAAKKWIEKDPDSAADIALGLGSDDQRGSPAYETALLKRLNYRGRGYENNPGAKKNLFNRLRKNARDSKLLKKQTEDLSPEEQHELLRSFFEGKDARSEKTLDGTSASGQSAAPAASSFNGYYDRLSAGNLHGYSPQLMALQSSLNTRRPPGAPTLIETGKIDYATLSYPAYAMSYDIENLDSRLRRDRILAAARLAGRTLSARDWKDPNLEATLTASVPPDKLLPRFKRRAALAAKARAALAAFAAAAAKSKDPRAISRELLIELSRRQKEGARWIAAAALEEELSRLADLEGFPTPELLAAIDAVPAPTPERDAYKRRGQSLKAVVSRLKANALKAQSLLESAAWENSLESVDQLVVENRGLKKNLFRDIDDFSRVPFQIAESLLRQPRWREWLDDFAVRWAPNLSYSRAVALRRGRLSHLLNAFGLIASGDAEAAHASLL